MAKYGLANYGIIEEIGPVFSRENQRPKRSPSPHQKQMRFFTILFITLTALVLALVFWFVNRPKF